MHLMNWTYSPPDLDRFNLLQEPLEKLRKGDPCTDAELIFLHEFLKELDERLTAMGPVFSLATREVRRLWDECEGYLRARSQVLYPR